MSGKERERGTSLADIREDHLARYIWAQRLILFKKPCDVRIADIFCGNGYGSMILTDVSPFGRRVFGYDYCNEAIEEGQKCFGVPGVELFPWWFQPADGRTQVYSPEDNAPYDVITMFESLEHVADAPGLLRLAKELLAPRGVLLVSCPNETALPWSKEEWPHHHRHYTPAELTGVCIDAGFSGAMHGQTGNLIQLFVYHVDQGTAPHHLIAELEHAR